MYSFSRVCTVLKKDLIIVNYSIVLTSQFGGLMIGSVLFSLEFFLLLKLDLILHQLIWGLVSKTLYVKIDKIVPQINLYGQNSRNSQN